MGDEIYDIGFFKYEKHDDKSSIVMDSVKCSFREDACFLIDYYTKRGFLISQLFILDKKTKQKHLLGIKELEGKNLIWGDEK